MSKPAVSVILPVYNREDTIIRAVDSVLSQTYQDFELIIVDDCSKDATVTTLSSISDPRIRFITLDKNCGAAAARNAGVAVSRGDVIAFLDSDDVWVSNKLERQLSYMDKTEIKGSASCTGYEITYPVNHSIQKRIPDKNAVNDSGLLDGCVVCPGSTLLVSKEAFDLVGGFDEELRRLEDWEWLLRYLTYFPLEIVPEVLAHIYPSGYGNPHAVFNAADRLEHTIGKSIRRDLGKSAYRQFRASLRIECAASCYGDTKYVAAMVYLLSASMISPRRMVRYVTKAIRQLKFATSVVEGR